MGATESTTQRKYKVTFLRGRRSGSYIEISEILEAKDAEDAVSIALDLARKARWHVEKIERMNKRSEVAPSPDIS